MSNPTPDQTHASAPRSLGAPRRKRSRSLKFWGALLAAVPLAGFLSCSLLHQGPYLPPEPLPDTPILDVHCHTAGIGAGGSGCFISESMQSSLRFDIYLDSFGTSVSELETRGDALILQKISKQLQESKHVGGAIILALDGVINAQGELDRNRTEIHVPNEFVQTETAKYTNLFWGASVNPKRPDALERLQWAKDHGAKLVKWIPSIMLFDPADESFRPFYDKLVALNMPLLTHAGKEEAFTHAKNELCDPQRLHLPLQLGVTVIVAHIASTGSNHGERDTDRLSRMMGQYTNLFSEISSLTQLNKSGYLKEALIQPEWTGRLLYGTDYPLINTPLVSPYFYPLRLTRRQIRELRSIENPWDRDVALKQALGVPASVFARSAAFFQTW